MVKILRGLLGNLPRILVKTFLISKDSNKRFGQTWVTISNALMTIVCTSSMYFLGLEKSLEGTASFSAYALIIASKHVIYYYRQNEIKQMLEIFTQLQNAHKEKWEREIFKIGSKDTWNMVYKFCLIMISYQVFYLIFTTLVDYIIGNIFPDFPSLRVHLPCGGFIEFFEPRTLERFIITIPVLMWTAEAITIHVGSETLVFVLMMYTKLELKLIKYKLVIIKKQLNRKEKCYGINTEKLLWKVIWHHQKTLEVLDVMKNTLGLPLAIHYRAVSVTLSVIFYCLMTFDERGSLTAKFNGITAIICIGSLLFALCYFGEALEEENNKINKHIYDLPWYNENIHFRRTVIMMLRQTQKPFVINYRLTANLNLNTFMQVINSSYSYLMVLKSTIR